MIDLFSRDLGGKGKPPLVLLHGLLGSSRNWITAGRALAKDFHVMALDLRNHGNSPHNDEHNFTEIASDVLFWLKRNGLERVHLMGHSMGGKTAMYLACRYPERIRALAVVDISPREKEPSYSKEVNALQSLPLETITSRADADRMLAETVSSWPMRQFLLTNLVRRTNGSFAWQANLDALARQLPETGRSPVREEDRFDGPALWIVGGKSDFIKPGDDVLIHKHFPCARIEYFPESGHNPHVEDRPRFVEVAGDFFRSHQC